MIIKPPITVSTTPNVRFKTLAEALFANFAETLAPIRSEERRVGKECRL